MTLLNPSFEGGWLDLPAGGNLVNQQPRDWELTWLAIGEKLWDSSDEARGIPECVHKLAHQLPLDEQLGGPNALILDGDVTYKVFHASASYGAQLRQVITGLKPGSAVRLSVPYRAHLRGDGDPWAFEVGMWVNQEGMWARPISNVWMHRAILGVADENGEAEVIIRVKSKWDTPKDFFIDAVTCECVPAEGVPVERVLVAQLYNDGTWESVS